MKFATAVLLSLALVSSTEAALRFGSRDPKGAGQPEPTKDGACGECQKHAPFLNKGGEDCVCFASDIMRTFENDATKELTTDAKYGSETVNTGAAQLASGWHWHCRPVSGSGVWEQC